MEIRDVAIVAGVTTAVIGIGYLGYKSLYKNDEDSEETFSNFSTKVKRTAADICSWAMDNPEKATVILTTGVAAVSSAKNKMNRERVRMDRTFYDPRTGFHWTLKRAPTNSDRMIITARQKMGEDMGNILRDLRLI